VDLPRRGGDPARDDVPAALDGPAVGVRADVRRARDDALLRPRPGARVRAPVAARGGAAPMRRMLVLAGLVALVLPGAAWAHATLKSTSPVFGHELQASPKAIAFHFDQIVKVLPGGVQVLNDKGRNFAGAVTVNGLNMSAPVRTLPKGAYTVRWHAISADSHVVSGVWTFGVRVPA